MISMMAFSMRYCTRSLSVLLNVTLLVWLGLATAYAQGISVGKADVRISEEGAQLVANYDINLTFVVQQALSRGIPLYFTTEFSMTRSRWYWLDEEIFRSEQVTKLSYNVLTRQYRISRGALFQNFATLESALNVMSRQSSVAIPMDVLQKDGNYIASARLRLDTDQLPRLLQVNALTGKDWTLDSEWYRWVVRPAALGNEGQTE